MTDEALTQFIDSQLAKTFGQHYKNFSVYIPKLVQRNNEFSQRITELEKKCAGFESKIQSLTSRLEKLEKIKTVVAEPQSANNYIDDALIQKFNAWALYSASPLSADFMFIAEDIKLRSEFTITQSAEPATWITNRMGAKKYLFPNPQFLDDRSNISAFYEGGTGFSKPKGQNKIKIIKPCEIENSGYISYPGKLQILP